MPPGKCLTTTHLTTIYYQAKDGVFYFKMYREKLVLLRVLPILEFVWRRSSNLHGNWYIWTTSRIPFHGTYSYFTFCFHSDAIWIITYSFLHRRYVWKWISIHIHSISCLILCLFLKRKCHWNIYMSTDSFISVSSEEPFKLALKKPLFFERILDLVDWYYSVLVFTMFYCDSAAHSFV